MFIDIILNTYPKAVSHRSLFSHYFITFMLSVSVIRQLVNNEELTFNFSNMKNLLPSQFYVFVIVISRLFALLGRQSKLFRQCHLEL